jgi:hypothetical protein
MPPSLNQPTPEQLLGSLGPHFQPAPFSWGWVNAPIGAVLARILVVHTAVGGVGLAFDDDGLGHFISAAEEAKSGLVRATSPLVVP